MVPSVSGRLVRSGKKGGPSVNRGRKGKGSHLHLLTDGNGVPLSVLVTEASRQESPLALDVVDAICVRQPGRKPRMRPKTLIADKGYDSMPLRRELRKRNIQPIIPKRQRNNQKRKRGRPAGSYHPLRYQGRWIVERAFAWMDNYRRITVRWDYTDYAYNAWIMIYCILTCIKELLR